MLLWTEEDIGKRQWACMCVCVCLLEHSASAHTRQYLAFLCVCFLLTVAACSCNKWGAGDSREDGMWQIINNHLSHRFPCFVVWQTAGYRQGAASSASQDTAAAETTHMKPQCSGVDFLHSRSILQIHQCNKQRDAAILQTWGEFSSILNETERKI